HLRGPARWRLQDGPGHRGRSDADAVPPLGRVAALSLMRNLRGDPGTRDNRLLMANAAIRGGRSATVAVREDPPPIDFLLACLEEWPAAHALVRAIECRKLWRYPLAPPVLDVGCGDGRLTRMLIRPPVEAGIDLNRGEVARAQRSRVYKQAICVSAAT